MPKFEPILKCNEYLIHEAFDIDLGENVIELKHGKWDDKGNCSACGKNIYDDINADIWSRYAPPFCPNCGAKIQEENDLND